MLFLVKLIRDGLNTITTLHMHNFTKIITGQILELYILNGLHIFACKDNINPVFFFFFGFFCCFFFYFD